MMPFADRVLTKNPLCATPWFLLLASASLNLIHPLATSA
jgi:hypothetical protein